MSSYYTVRTDQGIKVCFAVIKSDGTLRTGLVAGDFTVTVVNPGDTATLTPAVSQTTQKAGVYCFTLTSGFMGTHGVGVYPFVVEIDTIAGPSSPPNVRTAFSGNVRATQEDIDTIADGGAATFDRGTDTLEDIANSTSGASPAAIADAVWDELLSGHVISGSAGEALARVDVSVSSRASQASVDAIQNVTRAAISIPTIIIPDTGSTPHPFYLNLFDTAGNPEDPDETSVRTPATNAADSITATDRISVFNGAFTSADLNRIIRVTLSGAGNDGDYIITNIVSGTDVDVQNFDGTDPGLSNEGTGFQTEIIEQVTVTVSNGAGTNRDANLDSLVMRKVGLGRFKGEYTAASTHLIEQLCFEITYTENAVTFVQDRTTSAVAELEDNFTAADRTTLNNIKTDTTNIETDTQDIQTRLPAALVSGRMDSSVGAVQTGAITAAGFAAGAIDAAAIANGAIDAATFAAGAIDAAAIAADAITAAKIATDAIGADELATSAVNEIRDGILSDSTPFAGADIGLIKTDTNDLVEAVIAAAFTATAGSTSTEVRTAAGQATGFFDGMLLLVVNTNGTAVRRISEFNNTNGAFFLDEALPFTPAVSDPVVVLGLHLALAGSVG